VIPFWLESRKAKQDALGSEGEKVKGEV
jgi:hypothetical protein